jgi:hypothetical protein
MFGSEEFDNGSDVIRLADALERLHTDHRVTARFGLSEVRHVGVDHAGRDGVDSDAARAKRRGEIFH